MEMGGFGLLNELCYVVPCLFVYLNVNYKASFPFRSFRASYDSQTDKVYDTDTMMITLLSAFIVSSFFLN